MSETLEAIFKAIILFTLFFIAFKQVNIDLIDNIEELFTRVSGNQSN